MKTANIKGKILVLAICMSLAAAGVWAHGGEEHVIGSIAKVADTSVVVKTTAGKMVTVGIDPKSTFTKDKKTAAIGDLKVGDRVVIHAKEPKEGTLVADTVEAVTPKAKTASVATH